MCTYTQRGRNGSFQSNLCFRRITIPHLYGLCKSAWLETGNVSRVATTIIHVEITALVTIVQWLRTKRNGGSLALLLANKTNTKKTKTSKQKTPQGIQSGHFTSDVDLCTERLSNWLINPIFHAEAETAEKKKKTVRQFHKNELVPLPVAPWRKHQFLKMRARANWTLSAAPRHPGECWNIPGDPREWLLCSNVSWPVQGLRSKMRTLMLTARYQQQLVWSGGMVQRWRALVLLQRKQVQIPAPIWRPMAICNSCSRGSCALIWPPWTSSGCSTPTYM